MKPLKKRNRKRVSDLLMKTSSWRERNKIISPLETLAGDASWAVNKFGVRNYEDCIYIVESLRSYLDDVESAINQALTKSLSRNHAGDNER